MRADPEQEHNVISWCLQNPVEFWSLSDRVGEQAFRSSPWDKLWPILHKGYQQHQEFPSLNELGSVMAKLDIPPQERLHYAHALRQCFSRDVSKYTGEEVRSWVAYQELGIVGEKMSMAVSSKHDLKSQLAFYRERLDKVEVLLGGGKSMGEPIRPLSSMKNWWEGIEEEYGAQPITTGCYRLNKKLRHNGIRPTLVLVVGPTGGGKSTFMLHTSFANVRAGLRWVYYILDDNPAEFMERYVSHIIQRPLDLEDLLPGNREKIGAMADYRAKKEYPGDWIGVPAAPDRWGPQDFLRDLQDRQRGFLAYDLQRIANGEKLSHPPGAIAGVSIDTGDQVKATRHYREAHMELEKGYSELSYIPRKLKCPLFLSVQGNQESVGATQLTLRNISGSYGKAKPAKLIIAIAQTVQQSQTVRTVDWNAPIWQDNKHHLWTVNPQTDKDTEWESLSLCIVKNTAGSSLPGAGVTKNVIIPLLVNYGSCRIVEDFERPDELMRAPTKTLTEEKQASGEAPPPRLAKRGAK